MLLAADIGNTNITLGFFDGNSIVDVKRLKTDASLSAEKYKELLYEVSKEFSVDSCIIASVVIGLGGILKKAADDLFGIDSIIYSAKTKLDIGLKVDKPDSVGADRAANAEAAKHLYSLPVIVVDVGTATTFDILDKNGDFFGGIIMPGINMQLNSLNKNTSLLPNVEIKPVEKAIGTNTENSILSGVILGHVHAVKGLIDSCIKEMGEKPSIVLTGGFAGEILKYTDVFDDVNPNLTLIGLKIIYDLNR